MSLCGGCLASDRTLKPVTTDLYLLQFLNLANTKGQSRKNTNLILFCWECNSLLSKLREFHCRVNIAQSDLKKLKNKNVDIKTLSKLRVTTIKTNYDVIITEDDKLPEDEIKEIDILLDEVIKEEVENPEHIYNDNDINDTEDLNDTSFSDCGENILENSEPSFSISKTTNIESTPNKIVLEIPKSDISDLGGFKLKEEIKHEEVSDVKNEPDEKITPKVSHQGRIQQKKCKIIYTNEVQGDVQKYIQISKTDYDSARKWFHLTRQSAEFMSWKHKCTSCLKSFGSGKAYLNHIKYLHPKEGVNYCCDVCDRGFKQKNSMEQHMKKHKLRYTCKICKQDFYTKFRIKVHLERHTVRFQCRVCGVAFEWQRDFYEHYKSLHTFNVCDYCGFKTRSKEFLERHILQHIMKYCKICNINFKTFKSYTTHFNMKHLKIEDDSTYCVECDIKFPNINRYKYHLRTAVKHIGKTTGAKYPCPVCKKEYGKKLTMKYHYQHHHLKVTKFYCEKCDKYMLNPFRLRQHNASVHDKIPPLKNKFCDICGRGFSSNKILMNHRRTHTGERPYQCEHCTAAFAQKYAMKTHMKTQHKVY